MIRRVSVLNSRKGNMVSETMFIVLAVLVFAIVAMVAYKGFTEVKPEILEEVNNSVEASDAIREVEDRYPPLFDNLIVFIFILIWGVVIVASFLVDSHPIFFIFSIIIVIFVLIAAAYLSNSLEEWFTDSEVSSLPTEFPKAYWLITHILETTIAVIVSIGIALYAKSQYG